MLCPVTDLFTRNLVGSPSQFVIDRKRGKRGRVMADPRDLLARISWTLLHKLSS